MSQAKKDEGVLVAVIDVVVSVPAESGAGASAGVRTRAVTRAYDEGWERTFGTRQVPAKEMN